MSLKRLTRKPSQRNDVHFFLHQQLTHQHKRGGNNPLAFRFSLLSKANFFHAFQVWLSIQNCIDSSHGGKESISDQAFGLERRDLIGQILVQCLWFVRFLSSVMMSFNDARQLQSGQKQFFFSREKIYSFDCSDKMLFKHAIIGNSYHLTD